MSVPPIKSRCLSNEEDEFSKMSIDLMYFFVAFCVCCIVIQFDSTNICQISRQERRTEANSKIVFLIFL